MPPSLVALIPNERIDWTADENDLIVADYFAMLALDAAGEPFVKAHRARALMEHTGRSHRSVEFKHMNISAVAAELGLPHVRGYRPMANYQSAIFDAIDRHLDAHPEVLGDDAFDPANPPPLGEGDREAVEGASRIPQPSRRRRTRHPLRWRTQGVQHPHPHRAPAARPAPQPPPGGPRPPRPQIRPRRPRPPQPRPRPSWARNTFSTTSAPA